MDLKKIQTFLHFQMNRERRRCCDIFCLVYPMKSIRFVCPGHLYKSGPIVCERCYKSESLTVGFQCQRCWRAQNPRIRRRVLHQTDVASYVRGLHLGDVEVSCVLGDEAPTVLGNKWRELVKHPAVDDLCRKKVENIQIRTYLCAYFDLVFMFVILLYIYL